MTVVVLVESPAKRKTIEKYLPGTTVESTIGHFRDLPRSQADVPEALKDCVGAHLGIDLHNDFKPMYIISPGKTDHVSKLRRLIGQASEVILATDDDREGEGISQHVIDEFNIPDEKYKRVVFTEITKEAVQAAYANPRRLDYHLAQAQETRRLVDRMYGYEVSRVLGARGRNLTAGRVQSVAVKIITQREFERINHVKAPYTTLTLTLDTSPGLSATSRTLNGQRIATPKDFDERTGTLKSDAVILPPDLAGSFTRQLRNGQVTLTEREDKPFRTAPHAPYTTSTLQQEASRKLKFDPKTTMTLAQSLYEGGFITYMRTDSTTLSEEAQAAARAHAVNEYGPNSVPSAARQYAANKDAQAAHEAIRPAGHTWRDPATVTAEIQANVKSGADAALLYNLIFKRTVASQMHDQEGTLTSMTFSFTSGSGTLTFAAKGKVVTTPGWTQAYTAGQDDPEHDDDEQAAGSAPDLSAGDLVDVTSARANSKTTQPPARYTQAGLVQVLESEGIGRPSTYAAILSRIMDVGYVRSKGMALVPTFRALMSTTWMERDFTELVDLQFTADMETELDRIAAGQASRSDYLTGFYNMLSDILERAQQSSDPIQVPHKHLTASGMKLGLDGNGNGIIDAPDGRCTVIPADLNPDELTPERITELLASPVLPDSRPDGLPLGPCPRTGAAITIHDGRNGKYLRRAAHNSEEPKTASIPKNEDLGRLDVTRAMHILDLKRRVNEGQPNETTIQFGQFGPCAIRVIGDRPRFISLSYDRAKTITAAELDTLYNAQRSS